MDIAWRIWFNKVKTLFTESVQLQKPDENRPLTIYTDGSYLGVGAVLLQEEEDGEYRVITTTNRSLSRPEMRLHPTEIEVCALYHALQKFRSFVFNRKIIVGSDSISLSFMRNCKLTSSRISRFIHEIMAYDIEIEYVRGTTNIFADMLSKPPP